MNLGDWEETHEPGLGTAAGQAHLQHMLLSPRSRGDLVLAGVAEVSFGALPVHVRSGLPTDHRTKDGIFPCGRKKQRGE